ncbi:hypothetical protein N7539_007411 [Penicillium diatomitis]|uniref:Uncharacterized protein n=1 Tax=Penicillium diatomitis TaxID=2819901 RepID=A0A9W9WV70_9EURO|nr:uncharacterized protein N7539_007411 [Penicillium diatomitis]KAJ5477267.1 hypothetical protein N7539_007411 [Penicillium diatomitis]
MCIGYVVSELSTAKVVPWLTSGLVSNPLPQAAVFWFSGPTHRCRHRSCLSSASSSMAELAGDSTERGDLVQGQANWVDEQSMALSTQACLGHAGFKNKNIPSRHG